MTETWLPSHVMELSTRQSYTYVINKYLLPEFRSLRMIEIMPGTVRDFVRKMQNDGASPYAVDKARTILSAIFTTALNDQLIFLHPCKGVKVPPTPRKPLVIVTPEQFDAIHQALPDATSRLLVETGIESGLRWGELAELRAGDIDLATGILTISRTVVELDPKSTPKAGASSSSHTRRTRGTGGSSSAAKSSLGSRLTSASDTWERTIYCSPCPPSRSPA